MPLVFSPNSTQHLQLNCAWSCINVILSISTSSGNYCDVDISPDTFHMYLFQNVVVSSFHQPTSLFSLPAEDDIGTNFFFSQISVNSMFRYHSTLDVQKLTGLDGLSTWFLKEIAAKIAVALTHLYNLLLQQGVVWRHGNSPTSLWCRWVSPQMINQITGLVVSVVAKILEKIYGMIICIAMFYMSLNSRYLSITYSIDMANSCIFNNILTKLSVAVIATVIMHSVITCLVIMRNK